MTQEIEIEFKNLLTKEEFERLSKYLGMDKMSFDTQENHYFDTVDFSLKKQGCALRIRHKNGTYKLTLKEPINEGLLETTQNISEKEAKRMLDNRGIVEGPVNHQLSKRGVFSDKLIYFGSLTTDRKVKTYQDGLIVLDYSHYLNQSDYEVEYEVKDIIIGQKIFQQLLRDLNIPIRKPINKIQRFFDARTQLQE